MNFQFSQRVLLITVVISGAIICLVSPSAFNAKNEYDMRQFARINGGKVYYESKYISEKLPRKKIPEPWILSGQRIVLVDMSNTRLSDVQIPKLIKLISGLPDVEFLDVRHTEISVEGVRMITEKQPMLGLIADEELLFEIYKNKPN